MNRNKNHAHLHIYRGSEPPYPNAADSRYFAEKALNVATGIVSGMGLITAMVFLVTMA